MVSPIVIHRTISKVCELTLTMENTAHTEALWNDSDLFVDFSDGKNYSALFTSLKFTGKVSENNKTVSTLRKTVSTNNY